MLENLILLRHAKAEPQKTDGSDFERALTEQGTEDAGRIGTLLAEAGARPSRIVTSPAARALATAERALAAFGEVAVVQDPEIFEGTPGDLMEVLARHRDTTQLMLVGHNPGISELAGLLLYGRSEDLRSLPTAGYAWLALNPDTPLEPGTARLRRYGSARA
jgi:phosphohistidine phosphatase SixA